MTYQSTNGPIDDVRDIVHRAEIDPAGDIFEPGPTTYVVGAYNVAEGQIALRTAEHRQPIFEGRQHCADRLLLDVTGSARSDLHGEAVVDLSDYVCEDIDYGFPLNVVATSYSGVVMLRSVPQLSQIHFRTWRLDGTKGLRVRFNWRCRLGIKISA